MKTDDLIALLASDPLPPAPRPWYQPVGAGALGLAIAFAGVLAMGINPYLGVFTALPSILTKLLWLSVLTAVSLRVVLRLSRPGLSTGGLLWLLPLAWLAMAGLGVAESWGLSKPSASWMGVSWQVCSLNIVGLSLPVLAALLWALRDMAPTRPALAGAITGVLAGSVAAVVYSLHCTETTYGFFTLWYGAGIAAAGLIGAVAGQRCLRW